MPKILDDMEERKCGRSIVKVGPVEIGSKRLVVMAGPCTVEDRETLLKTAIAVKGAGASILRGGAFKIRTSPDSFQGLGEEALILLAEARKQSKMPVVTEIIDPADVALVSRYADMLQIGSRNMQNTALLKAVGRCHVPILLKRGFSNTIDEWLSAADYILAEGNDQVVLCERGIRTFETSTRFSMDILSVPVIKSRSKLPIIVDPSHAAGRRDLVIALSRAAIAAGADGLLIEVNIDPLSARVDGQQTISTDQFRDLMSQIKTLAGALNREV
jgi:3-deoxy-7-phosphoheptulonate synthase